MAALAYLIIIVNAANWGSTDIRRTPFPTMQDCRAALEGMRTFTTATQVGDKSGMIAVAYCSPNQFTWRGVDPGGKEIWQ